MHGQQPGSERQAQTSSSPSGSSPLLHKRRYRNLLVSAGVSIAATAVIPLLIMTFINYSQYQDAMHRELVRPVARITSNAKHSIELNLSERLSALSFVIREAAHEKLCESDCLQRILRNLQSTFGGFVDLGLIDGKGLQVSYAGPYELEGKNYRDQEWFRAVNVRGVYVSDVFMGYRRFPHFIIAVRHHTQTGTTYVLRATIDTELINRQIAGLEPLEQSDSFIINQEGVLQTRSRFFGKVLDKSGIEIPPFSPHPEVIEIESENGEIMIIGYAYIAHSPFIVIELLKAGTAHEGWLSLRSRLLLFLIVSVILVLGVVFWGTRYMVRRIREVDIKRATIFHKMEYTNKMAAIGRLGAGVAHEINNPLAIIGEKAGLLKDLLSYSDEMPSREKILQLVESVLKSADRCSTITRRLLGFAKHMDIKQEKIDLQMLCKEVLGFLEKEASYRDVKVSFDVPDDLPMIKSDRGQMQQVFLNIINNAFAAVEDGGRIEIAMRETAEGTVKVAITDNGLGIPEENLKNIFEPFFTTKKGYGTGLGLSITYGIVEKMGGEIDVESQEGKGTTFTITFPIARGMG